MPSDLAMLQGSGAVLEYYARLKGIPVDKVLRNAARDFVFAAYRETPQAPQIRPNPWALVPGRGRYAGRGVHLHIPDYPPMEQARLAAYRIAPPRRGYALAAFLPAIAGLELKKRPPRKPAPASTLIRSGRFFAQARDPYKGGWKRGIEAFRATRTQTHNSPSDYSRTEAGGNALQPWRTLEITEYDLSCYPQWETMASAAGWRTAADNIMRDLVRILSNPPPPAR